MYVIDYDIVGSLIFRVSSFTHRMLLTVILMVMLPHHLETRAALAEDENRFAISHSALSLKETTDKVYKAYDKNKRPPAGEYLSVFLFRIVKSWSTLLTHICVNDVENNVI